MLADHAVTARWRLVATENRSTGADTLRWFDDYFGRAAASKFLTGQTLPGKDRKQFRVSIDFLFGPETFAKVYEGRYD